jgi:hypothetical protein
MTDEIINELWKIKDDMAKHFDYNLDDLATALRKREKESGSFVVDLSSRHKKSKPDLM